MSSALKDSLILFVVLGIIFFWQLGSRPLSAPDEARYSEIPREMIVNHDYVTPHLNQIKYFEKPAFFYWTQVAAIKLRGYSESALRTPTALFALLGCLGMYWLGRSLYDRKTGWYAALILASSLLYFLMAHVITIDMTLTFLLFCSLACLMVAIHRPPDYVHRRALFFAAYAFAGIAVLTKGLVGLIFPGAIYLAWIMIFNEWRILKTSYLHWGILIILLINAPWHVMVQWRNPEFFHFYFIEQQFSRFFTLYAGRYEPNWFFIPVLLLGFFPWSIYLPQTIKQGIPSSWRNRFQAKKEVFLLLWASIIFAFFSFSHSKLIPYILPIFPPLALLLANYFCQMQDGLKKSFLISCWILPIISSLLILTVYLSLHRYTFAMNGDINQYLVEISIILILGAIGTLLTALKYKSVRYPFYILLLTGFLVELNFVTIAPRVDTSSIKSLAMQIKQLQKPGDKVIAYRHYYQDLPYYLQQPIIIVDWTNELTFGMQHQDLTGLVLSEVEFWQLWQSQTRVWVIMNRKNYQRLLQENKFNFYLLNSTDDDILLTNHLKQ